MALPLGVSWLCILLLRGCICFPAERGNNIAHGYPLSDDEFSSYGGVLAPHTSDQLYYGASSNTGHDSFNPKDQIRAMRPQSFVSLRREPVPHDHRKEGSGPITSLTELRLVQSKPASGYEPNKFFVIPSTPFVRQRERANTGYDQHPPGILMEQHTQNKVVEGVSFPTIKDFKRFVESMKGSFLKPGSDVDIHFQTAQKTMENEMLSNAQRIREESHTGYRSNYIKKKPAQNDASENEVWNEPLNTVFEQGANYQMPSEDLFVPDPAIFTAGIVSTSDYDSQESGPGPVFYPSPDLAVVEHGSSDYGSFSNVGMSRENLDSTLGVQGEDEHGPLPSSSFSGEDFSFSGHVTAPLTNLLTSPSEGLSHHSSKTSNLASEQNSQQPKYASYSISDGDFFRGYRKPSGGFNKPSNQVLQGQKLSKVPQIDNVLSAQKPSSFSSSTEQIRPSSYGTSLYVNAPRGNLYIPARVPKRKEKPAPLVQTYQAPGKESKDISHPSTVQLPVSSGFDSSSNNLSPQSSGGHVSVQTGSPHYSQGEVSTTKQPVRSHLGLVFTVKPSSSHYGSSRPDGYLSDYRVYVTHPSIPAAQGEGQEKSDLSILNQVPIIQEPKRMTNKPHIQIPVSSVFDSTQSGIASQVSDGDVSFNSPTDPAPSSEPKKAFASLVASEESIKQEQNDFAFRTSDSDIGSYSLHSTSGDNKGMSRNVGTKNIISSRVPMTSQLGDIPGVRKTPSSFSNQNGQVGSQNSGGYVSRTRVGPYKPFNPPTMEKSQVSMQNHKVNVKEPSNMTHRPATQLPVSKVFDCTSAQSGVYQRNGGYVNSQGLTLQTDSNMSPPLLPSYVVKSRNGYVRGKMFFSQTRYTPSLLSGGKAANDLWKPGRSQHEYKNTRSQNVKGL